MMILMSFAAGCATTNKTLVKAGVDIAKIEKGEKAPEDGTFLTPEGTKQMARIVKERDSLHKERDALREELMNYPDSWTRFTEGAGLFGLGVGTGIILKVLVP